MQTVIRFSEFHTGYLTLLNARSYKLGTTVFLRNEEFLSQATKFAHFHGISMFSRNRGQIRHIFDGFRQL